MSTDKVKRKINEALKLFSDAGIEDLLLVGASRDHTHMILLGRLEILGIVLSQAFIENDDLRTLAFHSLVCAQEIGGFDSEKSLH